MQRGNKLRDCWSNRATKNWLLTRDVEILLVFKYYAKRLRISLQKIIFPPLSGLKSLKKIWSLDLRLFEIRKSVEIKFSNTKEKKINFILFYQQKFHASKSKSIKDKTIPLHSVFETTINLFSRSRNLQNTPLPSNRKNHQSSRTLSIPVPRHSFGEKRLATRERARPKILAPSLCQVSPPFFSLSPISHQPNLRVSSRMFKEHPVFKVCTVGRASEHAFIIMGEWKNRGSFGAHAAVIDATCSFCRFFVLKESQPVEKREGKENGYAILLRSRDGGRELLLRIGSWKKSSLATFNRVKSIRRKVGGVLRELVENGVASRDC